MSLKNLDEIRTLNMSEELLRFAGKLTDDPRTAVAALALTLGRVCGATGVNFDDALALVRLAREEALTGEKDGGHVEEATPITQETGTGGRYACCGKVPAYVGGKPAPHAEDCTHKVS